MKSKREKSSNFIVDNLIKIMNDRKLTKSAFAEKIGFPEAKWNKISNGNQELYTSDLSKIAEGLNLREIDILTYPQVYVEQESMNKEPMEAILQIKLNRDKKDQVLKLVFGENNLEILNR